MGAIFGSCPVALSQSSPPSYSLDECASNCHVGCTRNGQLRSLSPERDGAASSRRRPRDCAAGVDGFRTAPRQISPVGPLVAQARRTRFADGIRGRGGGSRRARKSDRLRKGNLRERRPTSEMLTGSRPGCESDRSRSVGGGRSGIASRRGPHANRPDSIARRNQRQQGDAEFHLARLLPTRRSARVRFREAGEALDNPSAEIARRPDIAHYSSASGKLVLTRF